MSIMDYGAIVKKNDVFINKNQDLFQNMKEAVGFELDKAIDNKGYSYNIDGSNYVYIGDENLMVCFYKCGFTVISSGKVIRRGNGFDWNEVNYNIENTILNIKHLDNTEYVEDGWFNIYDREDFDSEIEWLRYIKRVNRMKKKRLFKSKTSRFIATLEYNGDKYEVIFGYGIDTCYNDEIGKAYGYSEIEKQIMKEWV